MPPGSSGPHEARWLVLVDLQHVFADEDSPWRVPGFAGVLPRVAELVAAHAGRVVLTRFVPPVTPQGSWTDYYRAWPFALDPDRAGQWDLVPEVTALLPADVPVVSRPTMGKWGEELLAATGGVRDVVLGGVATDCCLLSTALAAADDGARVRVESAACAGGTAADHDRALDALRLYAPQVEVV